ncbi:MAG TPA: hypothetical protein VFS35_09070, partial [Terrimicrobiaceae bacterium]|nr:hypothetical protein [Terrimicrobiaceae bacterium]
MKTTPASRAGQGRTVDPATHRKVKRQHAFAFALLLSGQDLDSLMSWPCMTEKEYEALYEALEAA